MSTVLSDLKVAVRFRDGDTCRGCGCLVTWADRRKGNAATFVHTDKGLPASMETLVVACWRCATRLSLVLEAPVLDVGGPADEGDASRQDSDDRERGRERDPEVARDVEVVGAVPPLNAPSEGDAVPIFYLLLLAQDGPNRDRLLAGDLDGETTSHEEERHFERGGAHRGVPSVHDVAGATAPSVAPVVADTSTVERTVGHDTDGAAPSVSPSRAGVPNAGPGTRGDSDPRGGQWIQVPDGFHAQVAGAVGQLAPYLCLTSATARTRLRNELARFLVERYFAPRGTTSEQSQP